MISRLFGRKRIDSTLSYLDRFGYTVGNSTPDEHKFEPIAQGNIKKSSQGNKIRVLSHLRRLQHRARSC